METPETFTGTTLCLHVNVTITPDLPPSWGYVLTNLAHTAPLPPYASPGRLNPWDQRLRQLSSSSSAISLTKDVLFSLGILYRTGMPPSRPISPSTTGPHPAPSILLLTNLHPSLLRILSTTTTYPLTLPTGLRLFIQLFSHVLIPEEEVGLFRDLFSPSRAAIREIFTAPRPWPAMVGLYRGWKHPERLAGTVFRMASEGEHAAWVEKLVQSSGEDDDNTGRRRSSGAVGFYRGVWETICLWDRLWRECDESVDWGGGAPLMFVPTPVQPVYCV
ncbi:hypothetical protein B0T22DRAFT_480021 [Podospora appendiculata]|uniref:Uncharacterized protein n=1 Tax=Podospora appendiculata TaxID=314037 RepID=A0AAE0XAS9_9PEZI|nr:hypothetical protein B0T22DRAFT_480021 [Podospora appendiculata]